MCGLAVCIITTNPSYFSFSKRDLSRNACAFGFILDARFRIPSKAKQESKQNTIKSSNINLPFASTIAMKKPKSACRSSRGFLFSCLDKSTYFGEWRITTCTEATAEDRLPIIIDPVQVQERNLYRK